MVFPDNLGVTVTVVEELMGIARGRRNTLSRRSMFRDIYCSTLANGNGFAVDDALQRL